MDKAAFLSRIERAGTILPPEAFRFVRKLLCPAVQTVQDVPPDALDALEKYGLCGWALHACPALRQLPAAGARLQAAAQREFASCAQRKAALMHLDQRAAEEGFVPIIIKGAANASVFYPKESIRPSNDIDFLLPPGEIARAFAAEQAVAYEALPLGCPPRHLVPFQLAGYHAELHAFFLNENRWGRHADLLPASVPLPGYRVLRRPDAASAFTLALLHFSQHTGSFTWDMHDCAHIARTPEFDWERAQALWRKHQLVEQVLPALIVLDAMTSLVPEGLCESLKHDLPIAARQRLSLSLWLLGRPHFTRFRRDWFRTRLSGWSIARPLTQRLLGSREFTRQVSGRSEDSARFWFFHLIALPVKRVLLFWR